MQKTAKSLVVFMFILALVVLQPMAAMAAYTPDNAVLAAKRLQDLGLIQGRTPEGDLMLNDNLTRAELVTVLVRAFGQGDTALLLRGSLAFPDTANHWASGYIAMAQRMVAEHGFTLGQPSGKFSPDQTTTSAEAVAFLMKFLGIRPDAAKSWPANFLDAAVTANLITAEDRALVAPIANAPATRGLVFYLTDYACYNYKFADGKTVYTKYVKPLPPTLTVDQVLPVSTPNTVVTGTVSSDAITVFFGDPHNKAVLGGGKFSKEVPLSLGENVVAVSAIDIVGNITTKTVTAARLKPLEAPADLTALPTADSISLRWTASEGAAAYRVKRAATPDGPYQTISQAVYQNTYNDTGLLSGTTYTYTVNALGPDGESPDSDGVSITLAPGAPHDITAASVYDKVSLTWKIPNGAVSYIIERGTSRGGPYQTIASEVYANSCTDGGGLEPGRTYYYVVTAVNEGGRSHQSTEAEVILPRFIKISGLIQRSISVNTGGQKFYYFTVTPADSNVSVRSSNGEIINCLSGVTGSQGWIRLTAGALPGSATITVEASKDGYLPSSAGFIVNVRQGLILAGTPNTNVELEPNASKVYCFEVSPADAMVSVNSSNPDIISPAISGTGGRRWVTITAGRGAGTAAITVTAAKSGYESVSRSFEVSAGSVVSLNLERSDMVLRGQSEATIDFTISPEDAQVTVISDNNVVNCTVGGTGEQRWVKVVTGSQAGMATITLSAKKTGYLDAAVSFRVNVEVPIIPEVNKPSSHDGGGNSGGDSGGGWVAIPAPSLNNLTIGTGTLEGHVMITYLDHPGAVNYRVKTQDTAFVVPAIGALPAEGTVGCAVYDNVYAAGDMHLGVYALDNSGQILAFTDHIILQDEIAGGVPEIQSVFFLTGLTPSSTTITFLNHPHVVSYKILLDNSPVPRPAPGVPPDSDADLYIYNTDISGVVTGQHVGIYALDAEGRVLAFTDHTILAEEITAPQIESCTFAAGSAAGSSKISALNHSGAVSFKIAKADVRLPLRGLGTQAPENALDYTEDSDVIDVAAGLHVGVYALDTNGKVIAFTDHEIQAEEVTLQ